MALAVTRWAGWRGVVDAEKFMPVLKFISFSTYLLPMEVMTMKYAMLIFILILSSVTAVLYFRAQGFSRGALKHALVEEEYLTYLSSFAAKEALDGRMKLTEFLEIRLSYLRYTIHGKELPAEDQSKILRLPEVPLGKDMFTSHDLVKQMRGNEPKTPAQDRPRP